jgi:hypothetical protein
MAKSCPDCGCRLYSGICQNCHEELWILENQIYVDGYDQPLSDAFVEKIIQQKEAVKQNKKMGLG